MRADDRQLYEQARRDWHNVEPIDEVLAAAVVAQFVAALDALTRAAAPDPAPRFSFDQWSEIKALADRFDREGLT